MQRGFTLLETMVSVIIIATSILYVMKIHTQTQERIVYMRQASLDAFGDSLFLIDKVASGDGKNDAYTLLMPLFRFKKDDTITVLKKIERDIKKTSETIPLDETESILLRIDHITLRSEKSVSRYMHFGIDTGLINGGY
jgi:prepilin-type N-terminal cleavage/methylation domain-containing protein